MKYSEKTEHESFAYFLLDVNVRADNWSCLSKIGYSQFASYKNSM